MKYINLICDRQEAKPQCASGLLKKYAKNIPYGVNTTVIFVTDTSCEGDSYRIKAEENKITVFSDTTVGFNAAVGYLVRHQQSGIENLEVNYNSDFRSAYFANHFYNYYHAAPVEEICEYLESLALWGQNTLGLWFDMHHFTSLFESEAKEMLIKMKRLFEKAKSLGMKTSLTHLANEYCAGAPKELLAENSTESGKYRGKLCGYYYTELCPSKKQGEDLLMKSFEQLLDSFSSVGLDYLMLWPYDQGGCTCDDCYPWGSNGFYKIAKKKAELAKQKFPQIEIIFSCWQFDHFTSGEWEGVLDNIEKDGAWIDRLMVDIGTSLPQTLPKVCKPIVSFPEISMYRATPWGGFGVNPFPEALAEQFNNTKSFCRGGALYSEGIYEDINKVIALELMRNPDISPKQIVLEYCNYHFGEEHSNALTDIILRLEDTLSRGTYSSNGERCDYPTEIPDSLYTYDIVNKDLVETLADEFLTIHQNISDDVKENWRYQQIYSRVIGDATLLGNKGIPSEKSDEIYSKLVEIYHAENAYYFVSPITRESIMKNRGRELLL